MYGSNLPDTRGLFLRGYGEQWHLQNNGSIIGDTWTLHQSGQFGQRQGDGIRNIVGESEHGGSGNQWSSGAFFTYMTTNWQSQPSFSTIGGYPLIIDASLVVPTAPENRPVNMAVRYLVKAAR
jgi:hypothetical protein